MLAQLASQSGAGTPPYTNAKAGGRDDSPPYQRRSASPPPRGGGGAVPPPPPVQGFNALDAAAWREVGDKAAMFMAPPSLDAIHQWAMNGGLARFGISRDAVVAAGNGITTTAPVLPNAHFARANNTVPGLQQSSPPPPLQQQQSMGDGTGLRRTGKMVQTADGRWVFSRGA